MVDNIPLPTSIDSFCIPLPQSPDTIPVPGNHPPTQGGSNTKKYMEGDKEEDLTAYTKTRLGIVKMHTKCPISGHVKITPSFSMNKKLNNKINKSQKKLPIKPSKGEADVLQSNVKVPKSPSSADVKEVLVHDTTATLHNPIHPALSSADSSNKNNNSNVNNASTKKLDIRERINEWKQELVNDINKGKLKGFNKKLNSSVVSESNFVCVDNPMPHIDDFFLNKTFVEVKSHNGLKRLRWPIEMVRQTTGSNPLFFSCNPLYYDFCDDSKKLKNKKAIKNNIKNNEKGSRRVKRDEAKKISSMKVEASFDDDFNEPSSAAKWDTSEEDEKEDESKAETQRLRKRKGRRKRSYSSRESSSSRSYRRRSSRSSCSRSSSSYFSSSSKSYSYSHGSSSRSKSREYSRKKYSKNKKRRRSYSRSPSDRSFIKRIYRICPSALPPTKNTTQTSTHNKTNVTQNNSMTVKTSTSQIPLPEKQLVQQEKFQHIGPDDPLVFKNSVNKNAIQPSKPPNKTQDSFVIPADQLEKYKALRQQAERHAKQFNHQEADPASNEVPGGRSESPVVVKEYSSGNKDPQMQLVEDLYLKQMAAIMSKQATPELMHKQNIVNIIDGKDILEDGVSEKRRVLTYASNPPGHFINTPTFLPIMHVAPSFVRTPIFIRPHASKTNINNVSSLLQSKSKVVEQTVLPQTTEPAPQEVNPDVVTSVPTCTEEPISERQLKSPVKSSASKPTEENVASVSDVTELCEEDTTSLSDMHDQHMLLGESLFKPAIPQQEYIQIVQVPAQQNFVKQQQQQHLQLLQQRQLQLQHQQQLQLNLQLQQQKQLQMQSLQQGNIILASPIQQGPLSVPIINRQGMIIGTARKQPTFVQVPSAPVITPTLLGGQPMILTSNQFIVPRFLR